jgi:FAD/FMN-containing dehydrogenase
MVEGEVRLSRHDRMLYATDASLYQVEPLAVIIPRDVDDAVAAVRACARLGLPILPRGGGTSLAGQCTNEAVVIDLSVNCRGLEWVSAETRGAYVEPGITVDDLNDEIASTGLFFAPDPATSRHANIGGCIGNNAAGARSIRYFRTSENVEAIRTCLASGDARQARDGDHAACGGGGGASRGTDPRAVPAHAAPECGVPARCDPEADGGCGLARW